MFGTHYINKVYLGSEVGKFYEVAQEVLDTVRDDLKKHTKWTNKTEWGLNDLNSEKGSSDSSTLRYVKKQAYSEVVYSKGVVIPESDKLADWMESIDQEPSPIMIELTSISLTLEQIHRSGLEFDLESKTEAYEIAVE